VVPVEVAGYESVGVSVDEVSVVVLLVVAVVLSAKTRILLWEMNAECHLSSR
jgi:hypothetical protein